MNFIFILLFAAVIFGICRVVDVYFTKAFRSKAQHRSGLAVRVSKMYGIMGIALTILGVLAIVVSEGGLLLLVGGIIVLAMGVGLAAHYLTKGIFYDSETFLISGFGKKDILHRYGDIREQRLYIVQGGNVIIELHMADGSAVSIHTSMEGAYPFLDHAFNAWCRQTDQDPEDCTFHDPGNHLWFPNEEET